MQHSTSKCQHHGPHSNCYHITVERGLISLLLSMENPVLVSVSPDKKNIKYLLANHVTMERTFGPIIDQLYDLQTDVGRTII